MSSPDDLNPFPNTTGPPVTGWVGWIVFASVVMIVSGGFNAIVGLAGLFRDESYFVTLGGDVLTFDYTSWGWIHLIFGILLVLVGLALLRGSTFARVAAIVIVSLNLISQFTSLTAFPFWSIVVIALDILVLYALTVHGGELDAG